ncbi:MAG: hypothetical protein V3V08_06160 [Nannocystaceae bacterium]
MRDELEAFTTCGDFERGFLLPPNGGVRACMELSRAGAQVQLLPQRSAAGPLPPRFHMIRYYGVFAHQHAVRPLVIPHYQDPLPRQLTLLDKRTQLEVSSLVDPSLVKDLPPASDPSPSRIAWGQLLARVFSVDVEVCSKSGGPMRVLEAVADPHKIAAHLHGARAPPRPSPPRQVMLFES